MRLNGWQRIGIVASVIWAIGAPSADAQSAEDDYKKLKEECVEQGSFPTAIAGCLREKDKAFGDELEQVYKKALKAGGTNAPYLRKEQRSWLRYQQDSCKFAELHARGEGPGYARLAAAECQLFMTLQRLKELREFVGSETGN
jgi:uncharacterized protein YecT (DUF1311 family)